MYMIFGEVRWIAGWVTVEPRRRGKETCVPSCAVCVSWWEGRDEVQEAENGK